MITSYSNTISVTTAGSLLLDDYPNAAAAYSLRKLRGPYIGDAIRVRRASDNTEQDIGFVNNELDTASLTTFCSGTDGFVTTWYDQSGNARNATQATAANQPKIVSSGSVILENSKNAIDFLGATSAFLDTSTFTLISQPLTYFATVNFSTSVTFRVIVAGTSANKIDFGSIDLGRLYGFATSLGTSTLNANNIQSLNYFLANGANSKIGLNNGIVQNVNIGSNLTQVDSFRIGQANALNAPFFGKMQEIIVYPSDQSSNRTGIETNINTYYSIY